MQSGCRAIVVAAEAKALKQRPLRDAHGLAALLTHWHPRQAHSQIPGAFSRYADRQNAAYDLQFSFSREESGHG